MTSRISLNVHLFKGEVTCTKEVGRLFQLELAGEKGNVESKPQKIEKENKEILRTEKSLKNSRVK